MVMNSPAKLIAALFVACIFTLSNSNLVAQSMHGLAELELATDYSAPYAGQALWISRLVVPTGSTQYLSAVRVNACWGITGGHVVKSSGVEMTDFVVGNGPNRMVDPGTTREVVEYITHPTWDGFWNGSKIDLALIRWDQPLPGQNLEIGSLGLGEVFEYVGYARPALPGIGLLPADGERRGWDAKAHYWGGGGVSSNYVRSNFWQGELLMGGVGTNGGSGSGGFNAAGELVSLLVYGAGSPNYAGASFGLRLDLYKDWIESYTNDLSCLPPPQPRPKVSTLATVAKSDVFSFCHYAKGC